MTASVVLNLHSTKRTCSKFVLINGAEELPLECVNSRRGPYRGSETMGFFFGTTEPEPATIPHHELSCKDAARTATFTLVPKGEMKQQCLPQKPEGKPVLQK